jgi:hypothetical protein
MSPKTGKVSGPSFGEYHNAPETMASLCEGNRVVVFLSCKLAGTLRLAGIFHFVLAVNKNR